ncbi:hypothetical protein [Sporosarcina sp. FA9]|uniref:hypothetical protein n=1 Tax=Sporosarcina sp. FA9 TaxID=3413030 RepID=UPI003F65F9BE
MIKLWGVHLYREGNTRTVSIFMKLFAEASRLDFNALVLATVEETPEPQYLLNMM